MVNPYLGVGVWLTMLDMFFPGEYSNTRTKFSPSQPSCFGLGICSSNIFSIRITITIYHPETGTTVNIGNKVADVYFRVSSLCS